jgi:hypothetical protein
MAGQIRLVFRPGRTFSDESESPFQPAARLARPHGADHRRGAAGSPRVPDFGDVQIEPGGAPAAVGIAKLQNSVPHRFGMAGVRREAGAPRECPARRPARRGARPGLPAQDIFSARARRSRTARAGAPRQAATPSPPPCRRRHDTPALHARLPPGWTAPTAARRARPPRRAPGRDTTHPGSRARPAALSLYRSAPTGPRGNGRSGTHAKGWVCVDSAAAART